MFIKWAVEQKAHLTGIDPILAMAEMVNDKALEPFMSLDCHKAIAIYIHPKMRAIEVLQSQEQQLITIEIVQPH